jgi:FHA domain-containing protein
MVELEVVQSSQPNTGKPLRASLDESGGTIGRAPTNKLALPDPERTVSRVHAQIVRRGKQVVVISRSSNGLTVDEQFVEIGDELPLRDGSTLLVGSYVIRARLV